VRVLKLQEFCTEIKMKLIECKSNVRMHFPNAVKGKIPAVQYNAPQIGAVA